MRKTFVITVSGSCAGAGKTRLIEMLLPCLANCAAVKVHADSGDELSVLAEDEQSKSSGKDTGRFLSVGARRAFLIRGPRSAVRGAVEEIVASGEFDVVVVESNAMAQELKGDLSFFVRGAGEAKPGAGACERLADVTVVALQREERRTGGE